MTTSYKLEAVTKLKHEKAKRRAQEMQDAAKAVLEAQAKKEASDARIAAKQKIIDAGGVVPNPKPVAEVVEKPKEIYSIKSKVLLMIEKNKYKKHSCLVD